MTIETVIKKIDLKNIDAELFSQTAKQAASSVARAGDRVNKATQLRRFYDEVVMWDTKASLHPEKFEQYLPLIRMLNAKAAYANGRKLVDESFVQLLSRGLNQIDSVDTLRNFKLFFEAFMGFYKLERPSD